MKRTTPLFSLLVSFAALGFYGECTAAATATNLVTICTSAKAVTQASKCTAWQYNVYSPGAFIETYPQVSPGPTGYTDPAYEYRLGSSITPTMGVKVCPTALVPGTSYTRAAADPCPNNVLIAASTVISSYAITTSAAGIVVDQVNTSGVSVVPGGPFVPSPVPTGIHPPPGNPSPSVMALDPAGQYLYAVYDAGEASGEIIYSFNMVNGVPGQVSSSGYFGGGCGGCDAHVISMLATAQHLYASDTCDFHDSFPCVGIWTTKNGVFTGGFDILEPNVLAGSTELPIAIAVDSQEQFLYWYFSNGGGAVADTVAIFSLNFTSESATLLDVMPQQGALLLGAK